MAKVTSMTQRDSRYTQGGTTTVYPGRLGWWDRKVFPRDSTDFTFVLTPDYHRRPWRLAKDLYGKETRMWLILQYNNIVDINTEFVTGKELTLPTPQRVMFSFLNTTL